MQHSKVFKYILDVEAILEEIDFVKSKHKSFADFDNDILARRAIERHLEIIGEAVNNIRKIDPAIKISSVEQIVNLRNLIIHAYDTVDSGILWGIIQKDIPVLKTEISAFRK
jgi:uncharacterized protein with HEPN domain